MRLPARGRMMRTACCCPGAAAASPTRATNARQRARSSEPGRVRERTRIGPRRATFVHVAGRRGARHAALRTPRIVELRWLLQLPPCAQAGAAGCESSLDLRLLVAERRQWSVRFLVAAALVAAACGTGPPAPTPDAVCQHHA